MKQPIISERKEEKILIIDLNNTLAEELFEYGPALDAAIEILSTAATQHGIALPQNFKQEIYKDIKSSHIALQDDWDNSIFDKEHLPFFMNLIRGTSLEKNYEQIKEQAIAERTRFSENYVRTRPYPDVKDFIQNAKKNGYAVYVATDANAAGAVPTIAWLGLSDDIDGLYCCPSSSTAIPSDMRKQLDGKLHFFEQGQYKPNALIIGKILFDHVKNMPEHSKQLEGKKYTDFFALKEDKKFRLPNMPDWASQKLEVCDTPYKEIFTKLLGNAVGIGDDYRDRTLFRNAGIYNVEAKYGTKSDPEMSKPREGKKTLAEEAKDTLLAVSFWPHAKGAEKGEEVDRLKLFSAANKSHVALSIPVDFICHNSISEFKLGLGLKQEMRSRI